MQHESWSSLRHVVYHSFVSTAPWNNILEGNRNKLLVTLRVAIPKS